MFCAAHYITTLPYCIFKIRFSNSFGRFFNTINRVFLINDIVNPSPHRKNFFFVKSKGDNRTIFKALLSEVIFIESKHHDIIIHLSSRKITTPIGFTGICRILENVDDFLQIHRSFIICANEIVCIDGCCVTLTTGDKVPIGKLFRKNFNRYITDRLLSSSIKEVMNTAVTRPRNRNV